MALSPFGDRSAPPSPAQLRGVLGSSARLWGALVKRVAAAHPPIVEAWALAGARFGWSLRLKRGERIVLYLIPQEGHFLAGVVLGERACLAAQGAGLPAAVRAELEAAPRYAEGRGLRLPMRSTADLEAIATLVALKLAT